MTNGVEVPKGWIAKRMKALPLAVWAFLGLLIALVPAGIVQIYLEREARRERTEQIGEQAMRFVQIVAQRQASTLEAARQLLMAVTAHEEVRARVPGDECDTFLRRVVAIHPRYYSAIVVDAAGNPTCRSGSTGAPLNVADRQYFERVMRENSFQVGRFAADRISGQHTLHLAAPLRDEAGRPVGAAVIALSIAWLNEDLWAVPLPPGSAATIADRDGIVLARSVEPDRFVGSPMPQVGLSLLRLPEPGVIDVPALDGVRRVAAYIPLPADETGLFMTVGLDPSTALGAGLYADRRSTLLIIGSLLMTFVVAITGFHAAVERPVQRLLQTARSWESQDWSARVGPIGGGREFERLAAAFDDMAETVALREAARQRATRRMQALVRVAPQIVLMADRHGNIEWTNEYWRQVTGLDEAQSRGDGWLEAVHPEDRAGAEAAWAAAIRQDDAQADPPFSREVRICRTGDSSWRWFLLTGAPIDDAQGDTVAWTAVGVDFHERHAAQAEMIETAAQFSATYESAPVGLCLFDRDLRYIAINEMLAGFNGKPVAAHIGQELRLMAPSAAKIEPILRQVMETGQPIEGLEIVGGLDGARFWLCSYYPVRRPDGQVIGVSGAVIDITARKRIEASERMLSREVDHRAKNALSVVRGLVRLSAATSADDVPALVAVVEGRIAAMSRAHNLLSREKWVSADLREILEQELAAYPGRANLAGPTLRLNAEAAQPLTLVMHEMVSNSAKYGALSELGGELTLHWDMSVEGAVLHWIERGGPPIEGAPERSGFGSTLIDANMGAQLCGSLERIWEPCGLHAILTIGAGAFMPGSLPTADAAAGSARLPLAGRRVLLADDNPDTAEAIARMLHAAGCEVYGPAEDILGALGLLEKAGAVDAALLRPTLQGGSVQQLSATLARRAVNVVHIGGAGALAAGLPDAMTLKEPVTPWQLRQALTEVLERHTDARPT